MLRKILFWLAAILIAVALSGVAWCSYQYRHECRKQCDWGDADCVKMCLARHFCPAHPEGVD